MAKKAFSEAKADESMETEETQESQAHSDEPPLEAEHDPGDELPASTEATEADEPNSRIGGWQGLMVGVGIGIVLAVGGMRFVGKPVSQATPNSQVVPAELAAAQPVASQTVTVAVVEQGSVARTLDGTGTVQAYDLLPVLPQAPGLQIQQVLVDEGDMVKAGQVMAILDDAVQRSQITEAIAQVDSAQSTRLERQAAVEQAIASVSQSLAAQSEAEAAVSQALAAKTEAEAQIAQSLAAQSEAEAAVSQTVATQVEAEAGREQALANLAKAKADLAQAERELDRYQTLADAGAISLQELDTRRTQAETAREAVRVAEANIKSAEAKIQSARANVSSAQARVSSAKSNVKSAEARQESAVSNVKSAEARLDSARANVQNAEARLDSARANVQNAEANIRSSKARVQQQQTQQEQTVVRAPANGIVAQRIARVGDVTSNSKQLFSLIGNGELELHVKIPETQLPQVRIGAPANVTSDADSRIQVGGTVREIAPLVNEESRQATVKISLPSNELLRPGMFLRAYITTSTAESLTLPAKAVLPQDDGSAIVYKLMGENTVQAQPVEVGEIVEGSGTDLSNAKVEIKSGLKIGDRVAVAGAAYLKDGDRVNIADENPVKPDVQL